MANSADVACSTPSVLRKPFLGGYRNKLTGSEYHHAKVQTLPSPWKHSQVEKFHREVQTAEVKDKIVQTPSNAWTQVDVRWLYLFSDNEKIIYPSTKYVYADEIKEKILNAVIVMQKNCRRWLAQKELKRLRREALLCILWDQEQDRLKRKEEIDWLNELEKRRNSPQTKDDFTLLFSDLQKWWQAKVNELENVKSGAELKAELWMLLDKEVKKIESIEKKRQHIRYLHNMQDRHKLLTKAAAPKVWKAGKQTVLVETGETQRARSLHDLYTTLCMPKLIRDDRISVLMELKETIKPYDTPLTRNLASLANREIDLILRKTKDKNLVGLRTRIRNSFWQFIRQPAFNPEIQRLSKLDTMSGTPHIIVCSACNQYYILPPESLDEVTNCSVLEQRFTKCKNCSYLENEGWIRKDLEHYKRILKLLKEGEEKQNKASGIIYLLQPCDVLFLVEKIWKSKSCLSGLSELKDLRLIRWDMQQKWTPWNCLLVTKDEAASYSQLENPNQVYNKKLIKEIFMKHIMARNYFSSIPRFLPYLSQLSSYTDYGLSSDDDL